MHIKFINSQILKLALCTDLAVIKIHNLHKNHCWQIGIRYSFIGLLLSSTSTSAYACDDNLLKIAAEVNHPSAYIEINSGQCEGRYGGLFSNSSNQIASVAGFENGRAVSDLVVDSLDINWPTINDSEIEISGVYLQSRFFYRMDAKIHAGSAFNWSMNRLSTILGSPITADRLAVSVQTSIENTTDNIYLPATTSKNEADGMYRVSFEILLRLDKLHWRITEKSEHEILFTDELLKKLSRNQFIDMVFQKNVLPRSGVYSIELTGHLANGASIIQVIDFYHSAD